MNGFQLKIIIKGSRPPVWRRIVIPVKATFENLNDVIQEIFGWEHEHLWEFYLPKAGMHLGLEMMDEMESADCTLRRVLGGEDRVFYTYDFGDNWEHEIRVEKSVEDCGDCAKVIKSKGPYMIEDCGGIWRYHDMIGEAQPFDVAAANEALARIPMGRFPKVTSVLRDELNQYKKDELLQIAEVHGVKCFQAQNKAKMTKMISERLLDEEYMRSVMEICTPETIELFEDAIEEEGLECMTEEIGRSLFLCSYGVCADNGWYFVPIDVLEVYRRVCTPEFKERMQKRWKQIKYCEAAVYLYGVIPLDKMVEIYNYYEIETICREELDEYLTAVTRGYEEPKTLVLRQDMIMDPVLEANGQYHVLFREQEDVPYYIPETKGEFLRFSQLGGQEPDEHFTELTSYLFGEMNLEIEEATILLFVTQEAIRKNRSFEEALKAAAFMKLPVMNKREKRELFEKMETLRRHIRLWNLRGFTQEEMYPAAAKVIPFRSGRK